MNAGAPNWLRDNAGQVVTWIVMVLTAAIFVGTTWSDLAHLRKQVEDHELRLRPVEATANQLDDLREDLREIRSDIKDIRRAILRQRRAEK